MQSLRVGPGSYLCVLEVKTLPMGLRLGAFGHNHPGASRRVNNFAVAVVYQVLSRSLS